MEEVKDKVRARSAAATEVVDASKELGDQITRLMAALTRVEQGSCPASAPNSPRHRGHGRGQIDRNTPTHPSSHNGWTGLGQITSACSSSAASWVNTAPQGRGNTQTQNGTQSNAQNTRDPNSLQCFWCQGWGHMARECTTPAKTLNKDGGPKGMWSDPPPTAVNKLATFPPWPKPKPTLRKAAKKKGQQEVTPAPFLNPDPIVCLVGHSNEAPVVMDRQEVTAFIDSCAQVSSISAQFCKDLTLQIQPFGQLLELEGTGGAAIPYLGFMEVNLQIPGIRSYNEDVLLLVIFTTAYSKMVLVMVGTKIIDKALGLMTVGELTKAMMMWRQAHFGVVMLGSLQLSCSSSRQEWGRREGRRLLSKGWPCGGVEILTRWCQRSGLHHTEDHYSTIWHHQCAGQYKCWGTLHAGSCPHGTSTWSQVASSSGIHLCPGSSRVPVCLCNLSTCAVGIPTKALVGQIVPANQVPLVVYLTRTAEETNKQVSKGWVLEALDLQGLTEWPESEQKWARELLLKWEHLFVHSDLDLGKTALIKRKIQLIDQMPFKKHYQHIPSHMYNDVRAHIQEMLDTGAIHKSHSPWASTVVLVWKKDGGLRFCINLRKLNNLTVKDAYSLPR